MKYETILEIDLKKLKNNIKKLVKSYDDYKYKIVDLKDNAHGMGFGIVNTLVNYGINYLLVGSLKESLEVRKLNKEVGILASYYVTMDEIYDCINNNINITIYNKKYIDLLCSLELKDDLNVEILIDNGSNLQGVNKKSDLEYIINKINETKQSGKRVIAVGTTSCRVLETIANENTGMVEPTEGDTQIFIYPGYKFKCIDGLITNFHLPQSTLLMLVSALAGKEYIMKAYNEAVEKRYRFFSFGDAMFIK